MTTPDYEQWIAREFDPGYDYENARRVLATHAPELCDDCDERQERINGVLCDHPNAPTIGRLLAIGDGVWTAEIDEGAAKVRMNSDGTVTTDGVQFLLRALKAVGE